MSLPHNKKAQSEDQSQMSHNQGRKKHVSLVAVQERKNQIIKLYSHGYTTRAIMQLCNDVADEKQWGEIGERQVQRIIAEYYSSERAFTSAQEELGMREAYIAQMEVDVMKMMNLIRTKKDWKPFEYINACKKCFYMLQAIVEIRGFNLSKRKNYKTNKYNYNLPPVPVCSGSPEEEKKQELIDFIDSFL